MADRVRVIAGGPGGRDASPGSSWRCSRSPSPQRRVPDRSHHRPEQPRAASGSPPRRFEGPPEPSRVTDGVGVDWPHTQAGCGRRAAGRQRRARQPAACCSTRPAAAGAVADRAPLATPHVLRAPARRRWPRRATARLAAASQSGAQTVYLSVPIAYRVVSYTPLDPRRRLRRLGRRQRPGPPASRDMGDEHRRRRCGRTVTGASTARSSTDGPTPALDRVAQRCRRVPEHAGGNQDGA